LFAASLALTVLIYLQMLLGAIVAGLHAGLIYNTWPSMDGSAFPEGAFALHSWWANFFENPGLAQFDHRIGAYLVGIGAVALWFAVRRIKPDSALRASSNALAATVVVQIILGIATLLQQAPLPLAALHQATAVAILAAALWNTFELSRPRTAQLAASA